MNREDRLTAFVVFILAVAIVTLITVGMWHYRMARRNFVEHGYQQVMVVGNSMPLWQKVAADTTRKP
jgi:FtsZ-interacting cell division protein ZipA